MAEYTFREQYDERPYWEQEHDWELDVLMEIFGVEGSI